MTSWATNTAPHLLQCFPSVSPVVVYVGATAGSVASICPSAGIDVVALISLVLAYVCIIGAFIYDLMKARPIRKRVDAEVKGMTKRRLEQIIREDAEREAAEKAAKKK